MCRDLENNNTIETLNNISEYILNSENIVIYNDNDEYNSINTLKYLYKKIKNNTIIKEINKKIVINLAQISNDYIKYRRWKPSKDKPYANINTFLNNYLKYNLGNIDSKIKLYYLIQFTKDIIKKHNNTLKHVEKNLKYIDEKSTNNNISLNILSFNVFFGENTNHINDIIENNYDLLFLQECSEQIINKLNNYAGFIELSTKHKGIEYYTYLGINKKNKIKILKKFNESGIIGIFLKLNNLKICVFSIHLCPYQIHYNSRKIEFDNIYKFIDENNLNNIPIIICGDTNMQEYENYLKDTYNDIGESIENIKYKKTYPNLKCKDVKFDNKKVSTTEQRYDRIIIKNCDYTNFKSVIDDYSDHYKLETIITITNKNNANNNKTKIKNIIDTCHLCYSELEQYQNSLYMCKNNGHIICIKCNADEYRGDVYCQEGDFYHVCSYDY